MYNKFDQHIYIENNDMHQTSHTPVDSIPCFPDIAPPFGSTEKKAGHIMRRHQALHKISGLLEEGHDDLRGIPVTKKNK